MRKTQNTCRILFPTSISIIKGIFVGKKWCFLTKRLGHTKHDILLLFAEFWGQRHDLHCYRTDFFLLSVQKDICPNIFKLREIYGLFSKNIQISQQWVCLKKKCYYTKIYKISVDMCAKFQRSTFSHSSEMGFQRGLGREKNAFRENAKEKMRRRRNVTMTFKYSAPSRQLLLLFRFDLQHACTLDLTYICLFGRLLALTFFFPSVL